MAYFPPSGSTVGFQSDPTKLQVTASIAGNVGITGNPSVSGTVNIGNFPTNQNIAGSVVAFVNGTVPVNAAGSVVAFQGTSPWAVNFQNSSILAIPTGSVITVSQSSVAVNIIAGSIAASFTPPANQSVSGNVGIVGNPSISGDVRILGSVGTIIIGGSIAASFTPPANQSVSGTVQTDVKSSVAVVIIGGSIAASFTPPANQSVSGTTGSSIIGTVPTTQSGTWISSVVNTVPSSMIVGTSIFGQLPAGTAPLGSIAVLQGTNPWIQTFSNSSILAVPVGSVITVFQNSSILAQPVSSTIVRIQANSIVGTYAEDTASADADKGILILGVRNDAIASLTSANLDYGTMSLDSAGRTVIKPFAPEDGTIISYQGSVVSTSVTLIQASAIGKKNYITDFAFANTGSVATLITILGGDTSIVGYTIAPGGGGSNMPGMAIPWKNNTSQDLTFKAATPVSILYATIKGYQAP